jgi:DNA-directed RNA polymerase omega subunit
MKNLPENIDSKYRFITISAKRCEMLQMGAKPKIDEEKYSKFTSLAMEEVLQGLIEFEVLEAPSEEVVEET